MPVVKLVDENGIEVGALRGDAEGNAYMRIANSLISHVWAAAGTTNAPPAAELADFTYGVNNSGAGTANVYWVINGVWVDTGATVANIHGA